MIKNILITGGSGLVGTELTQLLLLNEYNVSHLSRNPSKNQQNGVEVYAWDVKNGTIDEAAVKNADCIIHLAGANIGDGRWTDERKKTIVESRVKSAQLLIDTLKKLDKKLDLFISASAIGYYGPRDDEWVDENSSRGEGFLADVCVKWEKAIKPIEKLNIPYIINRIGIVLSEKGGALKEMTQPMQLGVAGYLGNGKQYMSWIHLKDLCQIFLFEIKNYASKNQVYNAVAPHPEKNIDFTRKLSWAFGKGILMPAPSFAIKLLFGEKSEMVLTGQRVSSEKIQKEGYQFSYKELKPALEAIYKS